MNAEWLADDGGQKKHCHIKFKNYPQIIIYKLKVVIENVEANLLKGGKQLWC